MVIYSRNRRAHSQARPRFTKPPLLINKGITAKLLLVVVPKKFIITRSDRVLIPVLGIIML
jgi:hypothetical protein